LLNGEVGSADSERYSGCCCWWWLISEADSSEVVTPELRALESEGSSLPPDEDGNDVGSVGEGGDGVERDVAADIFSLSLP
jgi:hypothetical protein